MVESLESHAGCHGTVANNRDGVAINLLFPGGNQHAECRTYGRAGVSHPETVVNALLATGERMESSRLTHRQHAFASAG